MLGSTYQRYDNQVSPCRNFVYSSALSKGITGKLLRCKLQAKINLETIRSNPIQQKTVKPKAVEPNTTENELRWLVQLKEAGECRYSARAECSEDRVSIGALWQTQESESKKQTNIVML